MTWNANMVRYGSSDVGKETDKPLSDKKQQLPNLVPNYTRGFTSKECFSSYLNSFRMSLEGM